jgi:glycosyltransferase involved in cell wall biosynthesis
VNILINTIPLFSPLTGVGNYTFQIARYLREIDNENCYWYFYGWYSRNLRLYENPQGYYDIIRKIPLIREIARRAKNMLAYSNFRRYDLYFEPNFIPINIPAKKIVTTIHDFSWKLFPELHPTDRVRYWERNFWKKIYKVDFIIAVSHFTKEEAIRRFGLSPDKIRVIHNGYDNTIFRKYDQDELETTRKKYNLPQKFMLFVGSIEPRKNLKNLILAYSILVKNIQQEYKLVLVGPRGWNNEEIMSLLEKLKNKVTYLGYVSNAELGKLYNLATIFVYPSLYEGFGLPPLEAMACGCPVVTSNIVPLRESCGNAAYYIDPYTIDSIAEGIHKVITSEELRRSLTQEGLANAAKFSWAKSAEEHLKVFEEAMYN